jgi:hypothetical protein
MKLADLRRECCVYSPNAVLEPLRLRRVPEDQDAGSIHRTALPDKSRENRLSTRSDGRLTPKGKERSVATRAALGSGPIGFTDPANGNQVLIPLSALAFDAGGNLLPATSYSQAIQSWLQYLAARGEITPAPAAPPQTALVIKAADAGVAGNNIRFEVTDLQPDPQMPNDPTRDTFSVKVTETETYPGLTPATIKAVLGTEKAAGTQPGLVHVLEADTPAFPKPIGPTALQNGDATTKAKLAVGGDPGGTAFNLEARKVGTDGNAVKVAVAVSKADPNNPTFTLTGTWTKTATAVTAATFQTAMQAMSYDVVVAPPDGGQFLVPAAGSVALSGGAETAAATQAQAAVPANP